MEETKRRSFSDLIGPMARSWLGTVVAFATLTVAVRAVASVVPELGPSVALFVVSPLLVVTIGPLLGFRRAMSLVIFVPLVGWLFGFVALWRLCALPFDAYWRPRPLTPEVMATGWRIVVGLGAVSAVGLGVLGVLAILD